MLIRRAHPNDAVEACEVMRRSITELCGADHHDDPATLRRWLANKQPDVVKGWIEDQGNTVLVALEDEAILCVGAVKNDGEITLNYVSPDARFRGVSRAMLAQLEKVACDLGNETCHLISTRPRAGFISRLATKRSVCPKASSASARPRPIRC